MVKAIIFDFNRTLFDPDQNKLFPGASGVLQKLSALFPLGLLSTEEVGRENLIFELGLEKFFKEILIVHKKEDRHFLDICQKLGVDPEGVLVLGDRVRGEIAVANKLGMTTVWFRNGKFSSQVPQSSEEKPDFEIRSLDGLLDIVYSVNHG